MRNSVSKMLLPIVLVLFLLLGSNLQAAKSLDERIAESIAAQKQLEADAEAERQRKEKAAADAAAKRKAEEAAAEKARQQAAKEKRKKELAEKRKAEKAAAKKKAEEEAAAEAKRRADAAKARKVAEAKAAKERKLQEAAQKKAEAERQRQAKIAADTEAWNTARRANTQAAYNTYLQNFASGKYVLEAQKRLDGLQRPVAARPATRPASSGGTAIEPPMVSIPAGTFTMGCVESRDVIAGMDKCYDWEKPARTASIRSFQMAKYEVTFDEWDRCTQAGVCIQAKDQGWGRGRGQRPVINVSWNDVQVYIRWLNQQTGKHYRLPTEAEWEYAARAGGNTAFPWGNRISCNNANYGSFSKECSTDRTKSVGSYAANRFALHDTSGNVYEWVQDCYSENYHGAASNGSARESCGSAGTRVLRGGSWFNRPESLRSAYRLRLVPTGRGNVIGFRLARTL